MTNARNVLIGLALCYGLCVPDTAGRAAAPEHGRPVAGSAKAGKGARCGNGRVDPGETCDDGNTEDGDYCPSNCRIARCRPGTERFEVAVELAAPKGVEVAGVVVLVDYPEGAVSLPGSGAEASVASRVSHVPKDFMSAPFDLEHALRVTIAAARATPPGEIFRVSFDRCEGAAPPPAKDFKCRVEQASAPGGRILPRVDLGCSVKIS